MTAAERPPDAPPDMAQLLDEFAAALNSEDDRLTILIACQLLARANLPLDRRLWILKQRALARYRRQHFAGSADDWSRILEINPSDRTALVSRAGCEYGRKNYRVALDELLAIEARFGPPDADELIWRGLCLYGLRDIAAARRDLKAAAALEPKNPTIWAWRAHISQPYNDDLPTSLDEVTRAMAALPERADLHLRHARLLEALGRPDEAIRAADAALGLEPDRIDLLKYRIGLKLEADADGALSDLAAVVAMKPDDIGAQEDLVEVLRKLGRLDEALASADHVIETFPDGDWGYRLRADVLRDMGDKAGVLEALRAAWKAAAPWNRSYGIEIARLLREGGDLAGAHEALDLMNRSYFTEWVGQALFEVLCEMGRLKDAVKLADQIVASSPNSADAYRQRARVLSAVGRIKEARADLDAAGRLDADECEGP